MHDTGHRGGTGRPVEGDKTHSSEARAMDAIAVRLQAAGERFMSLFDDGDDAAASPAQASVHIDKATPPRPPLSLTRNPRS